MYNKSVKRQVPKLMYGTLQQKNSLSAPSQYVPPAPEMACLENSFNLHTRLWRRADTSGTPTDKTFSAMVNCYYCCLTTVISCPSDGNRISGEKENPPRLTSNLSDRAPGAPQWKRTWLDSVTYAVTRSGPSSFLRLSYIPRPRPSPRERKRRNPPHSLMPVRSIRYRRGI